MVRGCRGVGVRGVGLKQRTQCMLMLKRWEIADDEERSV
jgi:hypothetical protein